MVQDCMELEVEVELVLQAKHLFVQLIHLEDEDKSEQELVEVEVDVELKLELELDGNFSIVEQALQSVQPTVQLMHLEDGDKQVQVVLGQAMEQVVVEQDSQQLIDLDTDVEQALEALQPMQPPVQLILLKYYYISDHSKLQVAQGQQKDLHYY
jgi:hypothetical protein